jgi:hypothetical protein
MGLLDSIKKVLGLHKEEVAVSNTLVLTAKDRVLSNEPAVATEPVVVKPKTKQKASDSLITQADLEKMSKQEIVNLGNEKYGIEMSMRRKKEDLIEEFLIAQKKA